MKVALDEMREVMQRRRSSAWQQVMKKFSTRSGIAGKAERRCWKAARRACEAKRGNGIVATKQPVTGDRTCGRGHRCRHRAIRLMRAGRNAGTRIGFAAQTDAMNRERRTGPGRDKAAGFVLGRPFLGYRARKGCLSSPRTDVTPDRKTSGRPVDVAGAKPIHM